MSAEQLLAEHLSAVSAEHLSRSNCRIVVSSEHMSTEHLSAQHLSAEQISRSICRGAIVAS